MLAGILTAVAAGAASLVFDGYARTDRAQKGLDRHGRRADGSATTFAERLVGTPRWWALNATVLVGVGVLLIARGNQRGAIVFPFAVLAAGLAIVKRSYRARS